jgi:Xaa-Pro aminopeptidase
MTTGQQAIGHDLGAAVRASFPTDSRMVRVQKLMEEHSVDFLVAVGADYGTWLTNYHRYFGGLSAVILSADGETTLLTTPDELPAAQELSSATRTRSYGESGFGLDLNPMSSLLTELESDQALKGAARVGVAGISAATATELTWAAPVELDGDLVRLSMRKDLDEAKKVAVAYNLCWKAQAATAEAVSNGASEIEVFTTAHSVAQLAFGEPVEFVADVLAGPNAAQVCCPVAYAGRRKVEVGEALVADIVVRAAGYWGDTCRTHVRGENEEIQGGLVKLVKILDDASRELRPGARGSDIHRGISTALKGSFPGAGFPHHAGHGLGRSSFEGPHLIPADDTALEAGMILAVEPGAYYPDRWGIRWENEYLVTDSGGVELNEALGALDAST